MKKWLAVPGVIWCAVFLLFNLTNWKGGWNNPDSRYAVLAAIYDQHTFQIDRYRDWTSDWAHPPDGHYYSNKAPGPVLLAAPLMWVLDEMRVLTFGDRSYEIAVTGQKRLLHPSLGAKTLVCLVYQLIPFCLLALLCQELLTSLGASYAARNFAMVALLFGNTADVFMNSFFGHGMAASMLLAAALALYRRRYFSLGFWFGLAFLSDYGTPFMVPALAWAIWVRGPSEKGWSRDLLEIAAGALPSAFAWIVYHTICFGNPWTLPFKYQNPEYVEGGSSYQLWGIAAPVPRLRTLYELTLGPRRGILFTQPWMFPILGYATYSFFQNERSREIRSWGIFALAGLAGLLWMNASFNGWHGGGSPGPRYLCMIFPLVAIQAGFLYDALAKDSRMKTTLWILLGLSVLFHLLVYCGDVLAPTNMGLWKYYWKSIWDAWYIRHLVTLAYVVGVFAGAVKCSRVRTRMYEETEEKNSIAAV